jgi:hypothetical protein
METMTTLETIVTLFAPIMESYWIDWSEDQQREILRHEWPSIEQVKAAQKAWTVLKHSVEVTVPA